MVGFLHLYTHPTKKAPSCPVSPWADLSHCSPNKKLHTLENKCCWISGSPASGVHNKYPPSPTILDTDRRALRDYFLFREAPCSLPEMVGQSQWCEAILVHISPVRSPSKQLPVQILLEAWVWGKRAHRNGCPFEGM